MKTVIIDFGSCSLNVGFGGDRNPKIQIPTLVANTQSLEKIFGDQVLKETDDPNIINEYIVKEFGEEGMINWDYMEGLYDYVFDDQLEINLEEVNVLHAQISMATKKEYLKIAEIFFEKFEVPFFNNMEQVVGLIASHKKQSGMVIDIGQYSTRIIPFYDSLVIKPSISFLNIGGKDLTDYLINLLALEGFYLQSQDGFHLATKIKETFSFVNPLPYIPDLDILKKKMANLSVDDDDDFDDNHDLDLGLDDDNDDLTLDDHPKSFDEIRKDKLERNTYQMLMKHGAFNSAKYQFSDQNSVFLDKIRYQCIEPLFKPYLVGKVHEGLHKMVYNSIQRCEIDIRTQVADSIILTGGTTSIPFLKERLENELRPILSTPINFNQISSLLDQNVLTWRGASVLSLMPKFPSHLISKQEYEGKR
ncbi:actin-17-related [Anaeramoeba ignava]|uniref:Actin-17-related n=1 Tax=Anaeramoeba ignava TaxID=1746090 RepID=A0A9Q0RGR5_ANAIG|nr:actin-17-related [Anaeramoeba ignava]